MQSGRTKSAVAIQQSLDGILDTKRLMKELGKRQSRHAASQKIQNVLKNQTFEDVDFPVYKMTA